MGKYANRFITHNIKYDLNPNNICSICNLLEYDDLYHFIAKYPMHAGFRARLPNYINTQSINKEDLHNSLIINNKTDLFILYNYIINSVRTRAWITNE